MIRLVVMYNLPENADEEAFLNWRVNHHQISNASLPGVLHTDFARVVKGWPDQTKPTFRFSTVLEWADMKTFENAFYASNVQADLLENIQKLGQFEYSICEILTSSTIGEGTNS